MGNLHKAVTRSSEKTIEADGRWIICESAIVAENDDPERQARLKVVIPSLDEDLVFDDWIMPAFGCVKDKFGFVLIPEIGSEVLVTGVLGQKYNLVYTGASYNEECSIPDELGLETAGMKVPKNLSFIAALLAKIIAQNIEADAVQVARVQAQDIYAIAQQLVHIAGQTIEISGSSVTLNADGSMTIHAGGNITVSAGGNAAVTAGGNLTLQGRVVNKVGPAI